MRSTLFFIPHEIAGLTVLGVGWALLAILALVVAWTVWCLWKARPVAEIVGTLPFYVVAAGLVVFILPSIETRWPDGTVVGLPIRGYGVMVLLGLLCGIGITIHRGQQLGVSADTIISLGFAMMIGGVIGARAFYVIQKWESSFAGLSMKDCIVDIIKLTEGGLVIYGGIIGGILVGAWFCWRHALPVRSVGDLIAPGFLLGLALGRVGCLLNGCCFGGVCSAALPTIRFPQGSAPYSQQLHDGRLLGFSVEKNRFQGRILSVKSDGIAATNWNTQVGDTFNGVHENPLPPEADEDPARMPAIEAVVSINQQTHRLGPNELPSYGLPVHPSQIYATINAALLCLLIWFLQPYAERDGTVFLVAVLLYACSRFLLELIRSDEGGQFGTSLTIAQWIAILSALFSAFLLAVLMRQPRHRVWAWGNVIKL